MPTDKKDPVIPGAPTDSPDTDGTEDDVVMEGWYQDPEPSDSPEPWDNTEPVTDETPASAPDDWTQDEVEPAGDWAQADPEPADDWTQADAEPADDWAQADAEPADDWARADAELVDDWTQTDAEPTGDWAQADEESLNAPDDVSEESTSFTESISTDDDPSAETDSGEDHILEETDSAEVGSVAETDPAEDNSFAEVDFSEDNSIAGADSAEDEPVAEADSAEDGSVTEPDPAEDEAFTETDSTEDESVAEADPADGDTDAEADSAEGDTDAEADSAEGDTDAETDSTDGDTDADFSGDDASASDQDIASGEYHTAASDPDAPENPLVSFLSTNKQRLIALGALAALVIAMIVVSNWVTLLREKKKPVDAAKEYLACMKAMNFDGMQSLLVSEDLSALENTDLSNPVYRSFFREINAKMTYQIKESEIDLSQGTARVNTEITYVDGTEIYKETVSDFVRDVVDSAFTGESLSQDDIQVKLAELLTKKSASLESDNYATAQIAYPLSRTEEGWKVVSLDDATVRVMSGNFKSIEEEIRNSLPTSREVAIEAEEIEAPAEEEAAPAVPVPEEGAVVQEDNGIASLATPNFIYLENDQFRITFDSSRLAQDYAGRDCLIFYYSYTNLRDESSCPMTDVQIQAFQNGERLEEALPNDREKPLDNYMAQIKAGDTVTVAQAFILSDSSTVTIQANAYGLSGEVTTQMLQLSSDPESPETDESAQEAAPQETEVPAEEAPAEEAPAEEAPAEEDSAESTDA